MTTTEKRHLGCVARIALVSSWVLGSAVSPLGAEEPSGFSGTWQRNADESDDPQEKFKQAIEAMRRQRGGGGRSGGMPGGRPDGMGGRPGGSGGRGGGPGMRSGGPGGLGEVSQMAAEIETALKDNEFHVTAVREGRVHIFYLDHEKHMRETPNGRKIETRSERKGDRIIIEQKTEEGAEITTTYELAPDTKRMVVTTRFEGRRMKDPVIIRAVYDSAAPGATY